MAPQFSRRLFSDLAFRAAEVMPPELIRAAFNVAKLDSSAKIRLHYRAIVTRADSPRPFSDNPALKYPIV
jgi:hypothetical protein